jgi:glycogen debranching enzyme
LALYQALKRHPIWSVAPVPGVASYPHYSGRDISFNTRVVGLRHYHDGLIWSWLVALSGKTALLMGDKAEADRLYIALEKMAVRDNGIGEVYSHKKEMKLFKRPFYRSEFPFSWGAGMVLDFTNEFESIADGDKYSSDR